MPLEGKETFNYCLINRTAVLQTSGGHTLAADDVDFWWCCDICCNHLHPYYVLILIWGRLDPSGYNVWGSQISQDILECRKVGFSNWMYDVYIVQDGQTRLMSLLPQFQSFFQQLQILRLITDHMIPLIMYFG